MSGRFAILRDSVGKILDVRKRGEDTPEKQIAGKFVSIKFPIIKRGVIDAKGNVIQQTEED